MDKVFLGIGSNVGDCAAALISAVSRIRSVPGTAILKMSSVYMTEPWGKRNQSAFLNQVIELETVLEPGPLLEACRSIESRLGRKRMEKWGPRTIDIDILLFDSRVVETAELRIPHPRLAERRFVLVPLAEIAPDIRVPGAEQTVSSLLAACKDTGVVQLYRKA